MSRPKQTTPSTNGRQEPLRVGFLIDRFDLGGTELNAVKVAESLTRRSVQVTVFHLSESGPLRERYERAHINLVHVPISSLHSQSAWRAIRQVKLAADQRALALLHTHCVYSNILGAGIVRLPGRPLPLLASRRWTGSIPKPFLGTINRFAQSLANGVLVNAPSLVDIVRSESPFSTPVYIPNLIPEMNFQVVTAAERSARRQALGLPQWGPLVGCVARLTAVKDHRTLFAAWRQVVAAIPDASLVVMGEGPIRPQLQTLAEESSMRNSIHFTGAVAPESMPHSLLDLSVLASLDEGFPNSLLEAMAQRVPVVSTRVGGIPDLIHHGRNGLLVPASSPDALASAMIDVLSLRVNVESLRTAGRDTAEHHRDETVTNELLRLYRRICGISGAVSA